MDVKVASGESKTTISIAGMVDEEGADRLKATFDQVLTGALAPVIVLNMGDVKHIGSSGIGKILLFYKNLSIKNSRLEVVGLNASLHELFRDLKMDTLFTVSAR